MAEFKMMHLEDDRTKEQVCTVETKDGKFRYELDLDYCKGLPEDLAMMPVNGMVAGGFCDHEDNLYLVLRGGGVGLAPGPRGCFVKLDPEGNYVKKIGEGILGNGDDIHFGNVTAEGTILITTFRQQQILEMDMDGKVLMEIGKRGEHNHNKPYDPLLDPRYVRIHRGLFLTEPLHYKPYGMVEAYLNFQMTEFSKTPFCNPNAVDVDSEGHIWALDGYGNYALYEFDRQGNLLNVYGGKGVWDYVTDTPGRFILPHCLKVDKNDHIWICDREKDAIHVFDKEGNVIFYCSRNMGQPSGVDTDGEFVYVVGRGGFLTIFDLQFNRVGQLGYFNGNLRGHDIAADSKGNLYLFPTHANEEHQVIAMKRIRN
ncbi:MAG: hypothetical protein IK150_06870 [Lachnospiraceae bacterium]|nr:hypothetical protein [Lachnospiraceae bacterium]